MQVPGGRLAELFGTKRVFGFCTSVDPPFIFYILTENFACVSNIIILHDHIQSKSTRILCGLLAALTPSLANNLEPSLSFPAM